ncbi:diguanylate cyclase PdgB [Marinobacterium maritimum]|uniref:diguanylate cyclase n=2 Tax=Marinobacterium maritimum TaxID=500162 RepID=A0ABN1I604_9GAMM
MLVVLNALPDPVFVLTESGLYAGLFGHADLNYYHDGHDLVGCSIQTILPAEVVDWIMEHIQEALNQNGLIKVEYPLSAQQVKGLENQAGPDGMIWFEGHIQPFPQLINGERAVIWVARNVTPRKLLEEQLLEASQTDPLTHAANRRRLLEVMQVHFGAFRRYRHPVAMIMFDIDHFKHLNDRFGHLTGDKVLRCLSDICRQELRENDLLARFGGEEFIIVLPSTTAEQAVQTAERIRNSITTGIAREMGEAMQVTVSLGVSELLDSDTSHEQVIQRVDEAMYSAKQAGRNRVVRYSLAE